MLDLAEHKTCLICYDNFETGDKQSLDFGMFIRGPVRTALRNFGFKVAKYADQT